ncbi:MAG: transketolase [Bacteroidia bacterium]|nr:transketolase [Bacteroidia bacterium]NNC85144.1 transketolase [Bacteroidia bacterium]NNM15825.1 transketolase [Bacteroidia bacterium]
MAVSNKDVNTSKSNISFDKFKDIVLNDYRIVNESRETSLLGRKEVLTGKAKFGIFGDGKEVAQLALAKVFKPGDFRAGYYRDQTFMMASGLLTIKQFFAQLYAHPDPEAEPASAGRMMNAHFATKLINDQGEWNKQVELKNSSADISPTAGHMPRLLGLAYASKLYRNNSQLHNRPYDKFSNKGNEVAFGTIGDASTSEGLFWETINAAGVLQVPLALSVWDDGYGISVPAKYQTTKQNISEVLKGFEKTNDSDGYLIYRANGWDYAQMCEMYEEGIKQCRENHTPVLFHIRELTQPQGHSTSGSHERYKSKDRLAWETEYDCIAKFKEWIIKSAIAEESELKEIESTAKQTVKQAKTEAWKEYTTMIQTELEVAINMMQAAGNTSAEKVFVEKIISDFSAVREPLLRDIAETVNKVLRITRNDNGKDIQNLRTWYKNWQEVNYDRFDSHHMSESEMAATKLKPEPVAYADDSKMVDGREILQANFEYHLKNNPGFLAFGEDVGHIGGVNQTYAGLQEKFGKLRVSDTGIREATIIGQGIGLAMRGLRPIAEIQYLDYLLYGLQPLSDDLATLQYRTKGAQKAPLIVSTRGHRLEGIWHSGSPIAMILGALRGMHVLVPRNMTQAAGFYNTILKSDEPALVIEPLNGYRIKEKMPKNIGQYSVQLGTPEIIQEGTDITMVTYGACVKVAQESMKQLTEMGISIELIDVQSLLPFDLDHSIVESIKKTGRVIFLDEDVPGGGTAYMMQKVLEEQKGYYYLDEMPVSITSKEHRPAYGSDGDYFSKPNADDISIAAYNLMNQSDPSQFPNFNS